MGIFLLVAGYLTCGVTVASFYRAKFNRGFADGSIETFIAIVWPLAAGAMLGYMAGNHLNSRSRK